MRRTYLGIAVGIGIAFLPFVTTKTLFYGAVNSKYFFLLAAIDALILFGAYTYYAKWPVLVVKHRYLLGTIILMLLSHYASAFLGVYPEHSLWSDIVRSTGLIFVTHIALAAVLLGEFLNEGDWTFVRRAIAVSAGIFAVLSLLGEEGFGLTGHFLWLNLAQNGSSFGNTTFAGAYLMGALIITLIEWSRSTSLRWRRALMAISAFIIVSPSLFSSAILFGRTPLSSLLSNPSAILGEARSSSATMLILFVFLLGRHVIKKLLSPAYARRAMILWSGGLLVGGIVGLGLLFTPESTVQNAYIKESSAARIIVWNIGLESFLERSWFGWGPENFHQALEQHFDNRLFLSENLGEIWFDRAHNVIIDALVAVGGVGVFCIALMYGAFILVVYRAHKRGLIGDTECTLLIALIPLHLLQLQTSFDTAGTYALTGIIGGYGLWLERALLSQGDASFHLPPIHYKIGAIVLVLLALVSAKYVVLDEYARQAALITTFKSRDQGEQLDAIELSVSRVSSFESLRMSSASFIKGVLQQIATTKDSEVSRRALTFIDTYEHAYKRYLEGEPEYYRARMNYAYLLLTETTLGNDRIEDARTIIRDSYRLSPENPLTYALDALADVYSGNLADAKKKMNEGLALNPDVPFSQEILAYIERQEKIFPNVTVLKLENL